MTVWTSRDALGHLDAFVQRVDGVVGQHPDRLLSQDPAGVDAGVHLEDGGAGDLDAVFEGVARAVHAGRAAAPGGC